MADGENNFASTFGNNTSEFNTSVNERKYTFHHYGKLTAQNTKSNSQMINSSLDNVYQTFLKEQELNEEGVKQRIQRLRSELLQKRNQKVHVNSEITSQEQLKEDKENRIEELELEKIKVKEGDGVSSDYVPFAIGGFIVILLTLYLFVFYSSTGYSVFYGIKEGSLGFINPNVFADAKGKGGGVLAIIILFPVIFLGLGFLIHDAIEKKKYFFISGLLFFTLITDAFMGYKITQAIHVNEFNAGLTEVIWKFDMIYSDINFYLIIALGFIVYVIWGVLLHYVLNKYRELQPDKAAELRIDNLNVKISEQRQILSDIISKINILRGQVSTIENEIIDLEKDIIGYENGVIPVNISQLKASVGEFMMGWFAYTSLMSQDSSKRSQEAKEMQELWLTKKIESLNSDK